MTAGTIDPRDAATVCYLRLRLRRDQDRRAAAVREYLRQIGCELGYLGTRCIASVRTTLKS